MSYSVEPANEFEDGATGWVVTDLQTGAVMAWCEMGLSILSGPIVISPFMEVGAFATKQDAEGAIYEALRY